MSRGGNGSHWHGCQAAHHDCALRLLAEASEEVAALRARLEKEQSRTDFAMEAAVMFGSMWEKTLPPGFERPAVCAELDKIRAALAPEPTPRTHQASVLDSRKTSVADPSQGGSNEMD